MTPHEKAYLQGFAKTAEAYGVDPEALVKFAKATPLTDVLGTLVGNAIPYGGVANSIGSMAGLLTDDFKDQDESALKALIPGVGGYRLGKRLSSQVKHEQEDARSLGRKDVSPVAHAMAETFGPATSTLASTLLGGGIGAAIHRKDRGKGFGVGAGIGAGASMLAHLIGAIAAGVKRRRTKGEQLDSDSKSVASKYLLPGVASYNSYKRLGRSQGDRDENDKGKKKDKGKEKDASAGLIKSARRRRTWMDGVAKMYGSLDPITRRALMASLLSGAGTFAMSEGDTGTRLLKGLVGAGIGGGTMYGLDSTGLTDVGVDAVRDMMVHLKTKPSARDKANMFAKSVMG